MAKGSTWGFRGMSKQMVANLQELNDRQQAKNKARATVTKREVAERIPKLYGRRDDTKIRLDRYVRKQSKKYPEPKKEKYTSLDAYVEKHKGDKFN